VIPDMPRQRPPHLHRQVSRHGKTIWYVRIGKGPRKRLRAAYGTPEFATQYPAALTGAAIEPPVKTAGSIAWAVALYQQSSAWRALSKATQKQRANILTRVLRDSGEAPIKSVTKAHILAGRERRATTPAAARNFLETMRGLFAWAAEADLVKANPTDGIKGGRPKGGEGFPIWTEADVQKYEARWPVGTRERVAFDVLFYTGLRRGDACRLGRPHVKDGIARIATEKSGFEIWVAILLPAQLQATLAAGPCGELTFIARNDGRPFTKESFGNWFKDCCRAAGVDKSAHRLRKVAATRAALRGYSNFEMDAAFGWVGGAMAAHYTRAANRERLALQAALRGEGSDQKTLYVSNGPEIPSPFTK
jgi:integrase